MPKRGADLPDVLTIVEAAAYLRVDRRTLAKLIRQGHLEGRQVAGRWRITRVAIQEYLDGRSEQ